MSKTAKLLFSLFVLVFATFVFASEALAEDAIPNSANVNIPAQLEINSGASYDLSGIEYDIAIAPKTYSSELPTGVYVYPGTSTITGSPLTINLGTDAPANVSDAQKTWSANWTLAGLFGADPTANFPNAGMYEFQITASHEGDTAEDWSYDLPTYTLQVLIKNNATITGREYVGWTLIDSEGNKVNSGDASDNDPALFSATNTATAQLNVTKQVAGEYASTTHAFPQTITLTLPEWAESSSVAVSGKTGSWTQDSGLQRVYTVSLAHGETTSFTVPVGTRYGINEITDASGKAVDVSGIQYAPEIAWTVDTDGSSSSPSAGQVSVYDASGSLVTTMSLANLQAASSAIAADPSWEANSDKSNNFASPDTSTTTGLYTSYMTSDYSFVFGDDPQTTPTPYRIIGINHDSANEESGLTFMAKNALNLGYPMEDRTVNITSEVSTGEPIVDTDGSYQSWSAIYRAVEYDGQRYSQQEYSSYYHAGDNYYPYISHEESSWVYYTSYDQSTEVFDVTEVPYQPVSLNTIYYNGTQYIQTSDGISYDAVSSWSSTAPYTRARDKILRDGTEFFRFESTSSSNWANSAVRSAFSTASSPLSQYLPPSIYAAAKTVTKYYNTEINSEYDSDRQEYITTTNSLASLDKIWIPSLDELGSQWYTGADAMDNKQYEFFTAYGFPTQEHLVGTVEVEMISGNPGEDSSVVMYDGDEYTGYDNRYTTYGGKGVIRYSNGNWNYYLTGTAPLVDTKYTSSGQSPVPAAISEDDYGCGQVCVTRTIEGWNNTYRRILFSGDVGSNADSIYGGTACGILPCFCL